MGPDQLKMPGRCTLTDGRLVLAFTGWMDGGDVSTGTVRWLIERVGARRIGHIEPEDFYIYNFPGSMEISALFRPNVKIEHGLITEFEPPTNEFYCDPKHQLLLFVGKEPNLQWSRFGDCLFEACRASGVKTIYFVGTFAGAAPHTREPRLYASVSDPQLKPAIRQLGLRFSDYEGPGSFATHLTNHAPDHGLAMVSLVAEIPGYIQGANLRSIEAMTRKLARVLGLPMDLAPMRIASDEWETQVTKAVEKDPKLAKHIRKLEEQYDNELLDEEEA